MKAQVMQQIRMTAGYDLSFDHLPLPRIEKGPPVDRVGLLPERIPHCKPKLLVKEGDMVRRGDPVFIDKQDRRIAFLSPGGGQIERIHFGPRRVVQKVVIRLADVEEEVTFTATDPQELGKLARAEIVQRLIEGGLWPFFREFPFRNVPSPDEEPPLIIVQLTGGHDHSPRAAVLFDRELDMLRAALAMLSVLAPRVVVAARAASRVVAGELKKVITHRCTGAYPADDAGVVLYGIREDAAVNRSWMIRGQDLLAMARLLTSGRYPVKRIVTVGGDLVREPRHIETRMGAPWESLLGDGLRTSSRNPRFVAGGLLKGYDAGRSSYVGFYETSLVVAETGDQDEFFGFMRPGYTKASRSRAFLSLFNRSPKAYDCALHGEERACINCGACLEVCPVAILPHYLMKCIHADELDEALAHGLLDCVECGLCTYVCPSKINLCAGFAEARSAYRAEMG